MASPNPFEDLVVPKSTTTLSEEFIQEWVSPFYMTLLPRIDEQTLQSFASAAKKIDCAIVLQLLEHYDWRTKITGAFFAAIKGYKELEDIIGKNLLKSELTYAGYGYCVALATFSTEASNRYLITYLDFYLGQKDLWYDQADAFCALEYIDKRSAEDRFQLWQEFIANKPYWNLDRSRIAFTDSLVNIKKIKTLMTLS